MEFIKYIENNKIQVEVVRGELREALDSVEPPSKLRNNKEVSTVTKTHSKVVTVQSDARGALKTD